MEIVCCQIIEDLKKPSGQCDGERAKVWGRVVSIGSDMPEIGNVMVLLYLRKIWKYLDLKKSISFA